MKVDEISFSTSSTTITKSTIQETTNSDLDTSIHTSNKTNWIKEIEAIQVNKTSFLMINNNSPLTLKEKITAVVLYDDNKSNIN